ncbi:MAG: LysR substrate-binding domain-containing protein [Candidatus Dormibacteraeota bacterium]|jgi:DNA-binding transcriptional LysR family regulator|nr:LysR substrate-binding domain-containing protein [Candidatus Dormibacteraeota bacterium]
MLLVHIEGFLEVARLNSVSRAAETLYVTQPTLTARLHALERELGERLFVRARHGMRLTDAGRAFMPYAERAVRALREGRRAIEELETGHAGQLQLAAAPAVSTYILPAVLENFVAAHPRVEVAVKTGHSEDVLRMVLSDQAQVGLGRALRHPDVVLQPFYEEELVLVVAPDHPFGRQGKATMAELGSEQLIMFDRTSSYYEITHAAFLAAGVSLRGMMELDNIEAAKKMVERALGVALLPRTAVSRELAAGALARVELSDGAPIRRSIVAMRRRDAGEPSGVVGAFLESLSSTRIEA